MVDFKKPENKDKLIDFKENTLKKLKEYLEETINKDQKKCANLTYWIENYTNYLKFEKRFNPNRLPVYKYGSVIDVNLGFKVGDEFGGKHYCVVLNKHDNKRNQLLTVIPLSSMKPGMTKAKLNKSEVYLGSSLYDILMTKTQTEINLYKKILSDETEYIQSSDIDRQKIKKGVLKLQNRVVKISKLKSGSYARCSQITTISKMRIFDPKNINDALIDIQLPKDNMKDISEKIQKLYLEKI